MSKILKALERGMSVEDFDPRIITPERLKINEALWQNIIIMLAKKGYIDGVVVFDDLMGKSINVQQMNITIDGLLYLNENTVMKRIYKTFTGVKEITDQF